MMLLTYEGHACFTVESKGVSILIDPYISDNPQCDKTPAQFKPDLILVTHGHHDHLGDAVEIACSSRAMLAGQVELMGLLEAPGLHKTAFQVGGSFTFRGLRIMATPAWHGNALATADGPRYAGLSCGFIIDDGEKKLYHAGDTALFGDMQTVLSRYGLDCALLPIGDFFTMGPEDAVTAARWLKARTVVPMHYNTFPPIKQDPEAFAKAVDSRTDSCCVVMHPGGQLTI